MPMDRARYPDNWEKIALAVKTAAGWKCQKCGKQCRKPGEPFDTHKRTLTVAHLNHTPEDVREENLMAMCAPCHVRYDAKHHAETRKRKRVNDMAEQITISKEEEKDWIPISWIEAYADWLTQIPAPFAANDERAIRAMLTKWKTNPKLETPAAGCGKDACNL